MEELLVKSFEENYRQWGVVASSILIDDPLFRGRFVAILQDQMRMMADRCVPPTWDNFTRMGSAWQNISAMLSEEQAKTYERTWHQIEEETKKLRQI